MMSRFRLGALVLVVAALLIPASIASAKGGGGGGGTGGGGGGGGGGSCATIDAFDMTAGYTADKPTITWSATTTNLCIDELAGSTAFDFSNDVTGFTGREVTMGRGTMSFGRTFVSTPGTKYTITVTVYAPNGKVQASQTKSVTGLPALAPAA
jgi:hypothetical protein